MDKMHPEGKPTTRGASVRSGLSAQERIDDTNRALGHDRAAEKRNQVPVKPKQSVSTDRGDFTVC